LVLVVAVESTDSAGEAAPARSILDALLLAAATRAMAEGLVVGGRIPLRLALLDRTLEPMAGRLDSRSERVCRLISAPA
jgi:hypothetical protein